MIEKIPFGEIGHLSTRTIFGAAALGAMRQHKADAVLGVLLRHTLTAACNGGERPTDAALDHDARLGMQPLFVRDASDQV